MERKKKGVRSRTKSKIRELSGDSDYEWGDITKSVGRKLVCRKSDYELGSLSKGIAARLKEKKDRRRAKGRKRVVPQVSVERMSLGFGVPPQDLV